LTWRFNLTFSFWFVQHLSSPMNNPTFAPLLIQFPLFLKPLYSTAPWFAGVFPFVKSYRWMRWISRTPPLVYLLLLFSVGSDGFFPLYDPPKLHPHFGKSCRTFVRTPSNYSMVPVGRFLNLVVALFSLSPPVTPRLLLPFLWPYPPAPFGVRSLAPLSAALDQRIGLQGQRPFLPPSSTDCTCILPFMFRSLSVQPCTLITPSCSFSSSVFTIKRISRPRAVDPPRLHYARVSPR